MRHFRSKGYRNVALLLVNLFNIQYIFDKLSIVRFIYYVTFNQDLFHLYIIKQEINLEELRDILPIVGHIQSAQVPLRNDLDKEGKIDYKWLFEEMVKIGYRGYVGLEYNPTYTTKQQVDECLIKVALNKNL